jgi:hypothetical protein
MRTPLFTGEVNEGVIHHPKYRKLTAHVNDISPFPDYAGPKVVPSRCSGVNLTPPGIIQFPA